MQRTPRHIILASHPNSICNKLPKIHWGAKSAKERGPIIASLHNSEERNCIGAHAGSYMVYRALAVAAGSLAPDHRADLTNTAPVVKIGPYPSWYKEDRIVSMDPWGADIAEHFKAELKSGYDIRPTIAVTRAHIHVPELLDEFEEGLLKTDGEILLPSGECRVTKAAIEPVWYLPGIAKRFEIDEMELRRCLFEYTGGMFPELITRPDLHVFLPPTGGITLYVFGPIQYLADPTKYVCARVHDECNGSDVFGSDICTCRPYLIHGMEMCIKAAQKGGVGLIAYNRKEGRALGEVTKFLVYNARKRQEGGDTAANYFARTECVAGVQDMRFQELMPDVLHWLGITKIDQFVSMSNMKHDAIVKSGISIKERVSIPEEMIPQDAKVEMDAKKAAGYFSKDVPNTKELEKQKGRKLDE